MKYLIAVALIACAVFPAFSQDANVPRYRQLSDAMGTSVSSSTSTLNDFDLLMRNNDNLSTYVSYRGMYSNLVTKLRESEDRMNVLIKSNARESMRTDERNNYERLLRRLEAVKSEFDDWLKSVQ